jgi:hypothetical protein
LSYNDIHVINQNFYYHQNFKEQIEDEFNRTLNEFEHIPGDQEGLFKLAVQWRKIFNSVIYNTATGYVWLVYLTNI